MKKILLATLALLLASPAFAQSSRTTLQAEVTTNLPDNTSGAITPSIVRTTLNDIIASINNGGGLVTLTTASPTISVDFVAGTNFALNLTASTQLGNPTNTAVGGNGCIFITKDLTSRTLSYNTSWKFSGGTPTLSTTTTTVPDVLCYFVRSSTFVWGTLTKGLQ